MKAFRLATLEEDAWELESGEARHAEAPDSFQIPSRDVRESLSVGDAVKLLFNIESEGESGLERNVERMWVIIRERVGDLYVGVLDSSPCSIEPDPDFLARGSEVVFGPEHIVDVSSPSSEYILEHYGKEFLRHEH